MKIGILKKAIEEAEKSEYYPYKIGAVIFKGSRILGYGHNAIRSFNKIPSKYKKWENSLHAEQKAIFSCSDLTKLKGSSILVIRISKSGKMRMAKPCDMCEATIKHFGIREVLYSGEDGEIVREIFSKNDEWEELTL